METVHQLMNKNVYVIAPEEKMITAYNLMKLYHIRHLPVVNQDSKLVGMLSDRDVYRSMTVKKLNDSQQEISFSEGLRVMDFMSWPVFTVSEDADINLVAEILAQQDISALVIEDAHGGVSGIITSKDLLALLVRTMKETGNINLLPKWTLSYYLKKASFHKENER